jgi:uncharacterized protein YktA (UPF0223 family)
MKHTKKLFIVLILLVGGSIVWLLNSKSTNTRTIKSPLFADKTTLEFRKADNWLKWMGDSSLTLEELTPYSYKAQLKSAGQQPLLFLLKVTPETNQPNKSLIQLIYTDKRWNSLMGKTPDPLKTLAVALDSFFNNTESFYGIKIERTQVTDTTFLFKSIRVPKKELMEKLNLVYDSLAQYADAEALDYRGYRILNLQQPDSSHYQLNASISIHRPLKNKLPQGIEFKQMPYKKNLLAAHYEGPFNNFRKALYALEQYKADYGLINMAIPYIALPKDLLLVSDSQQVKLEVFYPYF